MPSITIYTQPKCVQCDSTKRFLDKNGVAYSVVDLTADATAYQQVREMGFTSAPVVITDTEKWSGFRLEKLKALVA